MMYSWFEKHDYNYKFEEVPEKRHKFGKSYFYNHQEDYISFREFLSKKMHGGPIVKEWKDEIIKKEIEWYKIQKDKDEQKNKGYFWSN